MRTYEEVEKELKNMGRDDARIAEGMKAAGYSTGNGKQYKSVEDFNSMAEKGVAAGGDLKDLLDLRQKDGSTIDGVPMAKLDFGQDLEPQIEAYKKGGKFDELIGDYSADTKDLGTDLDELAWDTSLTTDEKKDKLNNLMSKNLSSLVDNVDNDEKTKKLKEDRQNIKDTLNKEYSGIRVASRGHTDGDIKKKNEQIDNILKSSDSDRTKYFDLQQVIDDNKKLSDIYNTRMKNLAEDMQKGKIQNGMTEAEAKKTLKTYKTKKDQIDSVIDKAKKTQSALGDYTIPSWKNILPGLR